MVSESSVANHFNLIFLNKFNWLQIRDAYMLKFFEDDVSRLPSWCNGTDAATPFCQILGEYEMEFPDYNTIEPYVHMNERCPSLPPTYDRPKNC
jgi:hypothetical protein